MCTQSWTESGAESAVRVSGWSNGSVTDEYTATRGIMTSKDRREKSRAADLLRSDSAAPLELCVSVPSVQLTD